MFARAMRDLLDRLASAIEEEDTAKSEAATRPENITAAQHPDSAQLTTQGDGDDEATRTSLNRASAHEDLNQDRTTRRSSSSTS